MEEARLSGQYGEETQEAFKVLMQSWDIQELEFLRLGCVSYVDHSCEFNAIYFKDFCDDTVFGQSEWSDCEESSYVLIQRPLVAVINCPVGKKGKNSEPSPPFQYKVWRHEHNWEDKLQKNQLDYYRGKK